jgi:hypothetical protein
MPRYKTVLGDSMFDKSCSYFGCNSTFEPELLQVPALTAVGLALPFGSIVMGPRKKFQLAASWRKEEGGRCNYVIAPLVVFHADYRREVLETC